jgi:hypothetical protein
MTKPKAQMTKGGRGAHKNREPQTERPDEDKEEDQEQERGGRMKRPKVQITKGSWGTFGTQKQSSDRFFVGRLGQTAYRLPKDRPRRGRL